MNELSNGTVSAPGDSLTMSRLAATETMSTLRDLIRTGTPPPTVSGDWTFDGVAEEIGEGSPREFLKKNPEEAALFWYAMPAWQRPFAKLALRTRRAESLLSELILVQHLLSATSSKEYEDEVDDYRRHSLGERSVFGRWFGFRLSPRKLERYGHHIARQLAAAQQAKK
jgi:hypothetical protein